MKDTYEDMLVTDIERIRRAKRVLREEHSNKNEAKDLIELYTRLAEYYGENGNEDERERAEEILYELSK